MDYSKTHQRAGLVQRLQALAQQAATDDSFPLSEVEEQLKALSEDIRQACNLTASSAAAGEAADAAVQGDAMDGGEGTPLGQPAKKQRRAPREFDFSRYRTRFVALELMYVGWAFQGFARQENTENTIEGVLFSALRKTKLIPEAAAVPISDLQYSRCGRTDRGVSALGQVVALRLRSIARVDEPEAAVEREYDYPRLVNKALPPEVRVLGWTPVDEDFNARFSAQYREYKYFIVRQRLAYLPPPVTLPADTPTQPAAAAAMAAGTLAEATPGHSATAEGRSATGTNAAAAAQAAERGGAAAVEGSGAGFGAGSGAELRPVASYSLDIGAMRAAAAHFVGEHDFRNFCKPDVATVRSFRRRILSFTIDPVTTSSGERQREEAGDGEGEGGAHQVFALTVRGTAFLWHQVRCMAAVLLMVGRGQEAPDVVARLLDIAATPRKPQYSMAPEEPLLLYACGFRDLSFRRSSPAVEATLADVAGLLHRHLVGAALTAACHARLAADERCADTASTTEGGRGGGAGAGAAPSHIPLLRRQTEPSIEERMARRGIPWPPEPSEAGAGGAAGASGGVGGAEDDDAMVE